MITHTHAKGMSSHETTLGHRQKVGPVIPQYQEHGA
jgi:hypothetical protein